MAVNVLYVKERNIYLPTFQNKTPNYIKQIILLMILNG